MEIHFLLTGAAILLGTSHTSSTGPDNPQISPLSACNPDSGMDMQTPG